MGEGPFSFRAPPAVLLLLCPSKAARLGLEGWVAAPTSHPQPRWGGLPPGSVIPLFPNYSVLPCEPPSPTLASDALGEVCLKCRFLVPTSGKDVELEFESQEVQPRKLYF